MTDRIKHLLVDGFRGATQALDLAFDCKKPVVLIFGENGSGKSTLVDAIECVGNGSTAFLDNWKLGKGKRKEVFIPSLGKSLDEVKIELEFGQQTYKARLNPKGVSLCQTPERPATRILRRKSLQVFIEADPAQRYKEVAAFLDIPQIEKAESSLQKACKEAREKYEWASAAYAQAQESLQGLWEKEDNPGQDKKLTAESWAREQANTPSDDLQIKLNGLKTGIQRADTLASSVKSYQQTANDVSQAENDLKQAREVLAKIEAGKAKSNAQLLTLLQDAKAYLEKSPDELCPVCEQTEIAADKLIQRLEQRLADMDELKQANAGKVTAQKNLDSNKAALKKSVTVLLKHAETAQSHFAKQFPQLGSIQGLKGDDQQDSDWQESQHEQAIQTALTLNSELEKRSGQLQTEHDGVQKQYHTLNSIQQLIKTLDEKSQEAKDAEGLQQRLGEAVKVFEQKRKAYVKSVLGSIAEEVDRLYQKIHPNEGIGEIKLKLDDQQRGSLLYGVAFGTEKDIQPQPYYSESHLDTLGLCIFLALSKRGDTGKTIVVLDDVLGSVDQQHLQKTLTMLLEEASQFAQLIMTTHYRPLRDQFRFGRSPSARVELMELKPWKFEQGIKTAKTVIYAEELRQQLNGEDFQRDVIASKAGQLFESLLEFISRTYRCKVPHLSEPRFTFGDLAQAPNKKLKQALKIVKSGNGSSEFMLNTIYDKLGDAINIRNLVGCHFNQWAGELADNNIREMATLALELADTLICSDCGSLPSSDKSGSYWECSCEKTQLHPLKQPT